MDACLLVLVARFMTTIRAVTTACCSGVKRLLLGDLAFQVEFNCRPVLAEAFRLAEDALRCRCS